MGSSQAPIGEQPDLTASAGWGTNHYLRDQIEQAILDLAIDRARFHEVPKLQWRPISEKAVSAFTVWDGHRHGSDDLHWIWNRLREPRIGVAWNNYARSRGIAEYSAELFAHFITDPWVYVFVEDIYDKMWVYEADPALLAVVLGQISHDEYLVVSKKFDWLLGEDHNDGVFACGERSVEWLRAATGLA